MQKELIIVTPDTIKQIVISALKEHEINRKEQIDESKLYSINKVSKILGVSHTTVKNLVESETIKTTPDNKITQKELNKYLSTTS